ncbi:MAG: porin [Planctomycetota bacterium]|jgi:hypothetical protein
MNSTSAFPRPQESEAMSTATGMTNRTRRARPARLATLLLALLPSCPATAATDPPPKLEAWSTQDWMQAVDTLQQQVGVLQDRVRMLESGEAELTEERAKVMRELIGDVLADADTRAGLFADETAGYDDAFFIASADGDFRLEFSGQIQARYTYNRRDEPNNGDGTTSGFEMRRVKLKFSGDLGENVGFSIKGAFNRVTGSFLINDAVIKLDLDEGVRLQVGRARATILREEWVSSKRQLTVERSLVARRFRQLRTTGVALSKRTATTRFHIGVADTSQALFSTDGWLASTRLEFLMSGTWRELEDFTSFRDDTPTVMVGAGILYAESDDGTLISNSELVRWTADVNMEFGGGTLFASVIGNHNDPDGGVSRDQYGVVVQGGYFVSNDMELIARYEWGDADGVTEDLSVITVGVNRYIVRHNLKWTVDIGYGLNEVGGFWSSSGAGWRTDRPGNDGQIVVRAQFQLLF